MSATSSPLKGTPRPQGLNPYGNDRPSRWPGWRTLFAAAALAAGCVVMGLVCVVMGDMVAQKPVFFVVLPVALIVAFMFVANPKALLLTILLLRAIANPVLEEARFASFGGLGGLVNLAVILLAAVFWMREPRRIPRVAWMVWLPFIAMQAVGLLYSPDKLPELRTFLGTLSTMARTSRTTRGISGTAIAAMTAPTPARNSETIAIASRMAGIAISPSMIRISTASSQRKKPAISPMNRPATMLITATAMPIRSETRAP